MAANPSILESKGFKFRNWPGGEEAAEGFGLSHAVIIPANARRIIVGGQLGIRDDGSVPENIEEEVKLAFDHVLAALKSAGLGDDAFEYVYSIKTFELKYKGKSIVEPVVSIARSLLKNTKPAWTGVEVAALVHPDVHLEITVEAYLPN
ncbi:unnamed protein product [Clonostachys solani]|uniref:Uncharacterized protein n=1 Tax=Clonostachys solani TaxID=160281 RepID=A0A9N9W9F7_9HYPO|nr:unnamed protein product [Clonostachys solani]